MGRQLIHVFYDSVLSFGALVSRDESVVLNYWLVFHVAFLSLRDHLVDCSEGSVPTVSHHGHELAYLLRSVVMKALFSVNDNPLFGAHLTEIRVSIAESASLLLTVTIVLVLFPRVESAVRVLLPLR